MLGRRASRAESEPSDQRQLQTPVVGIDADRRAEHVQLEAFFDSAEYSEHPEEIRLHAGSAWRSREHSRAEVVLADGVTRKVDAQLRHLAQHERRKRVRVRSGPDAVAALVGVRLDGALDSGD